MRALPFFTRSGYLATALGLATCNTPDPAFNASVFPERITFTADRQYPEGLAYAPALDRFVVSSLTQGKVGTVDQNGRYRDFVRDSRLISATGLSVRDGKLYVCNGDLGVSVKSTARTIQKTAGLLVFDLATSQLIRAVRLDSLLPGVNHFANDIAFDRAGNAYVTDSFAPVVYRVTPTYDMSQFVNSALFSGAGFNLNGIVYHPDNFLIVVKANEGKLFKIDVQRPGQITEITGVSLPGGDGMVLHNNDLYVVYGQKRVAQVRSADGWKTAALVKTDTVGYEQATTNAVVNGRIYTLNARIGEVNAAAADGDTNRLRAATYSIQQFR